MKKLMIATALLLVASMGFAAMDSVTFSVGALNPGQTLTNTAVIRGYLENVKITSGKLLDTTTVTIASSGKTLFSVTKVTGTNWYAGPLSQKYSTAGAALTYVGSTDSTGTNILYGRIAVAGPVTCTILNDSVITTNTPTVELMFDK